MYVCIYVCMLLKIEKYIQTGVSFHIVCVCVCVCLQYLKSHMHKEMQSSKTTHTAYDLLRTPVMRRISICLVAVW